MGEYGCQKHKIEIPVRVGKGEVLRLNVTFGIIQLIENIGMDKFEIRTPGGDFFPAPFNSGFRNVKAAVFSFPGKKRNKRQGHPSYSASDVKYPVIRFYRPKSGKVLEKLLPDPFKISSADEIFMRGRNHVVFIEE
jgi:hypothetical protein